jgi:hypothetical protein
LAAEDASPKLRLRDEHRLVAGSEAALIRQIRSTFTTLRRRTEMGDTECLRRHTRLSRDAGEVPPNAGRWRVPTRRPRLTLDRVRHGPAVAGDERTRGSARDRARSFVAGPAGRAGSAAPQARPSGRTRGRRWGSRGATVLVRACAPTLATRRSAAAPEPASRAGGLCRRSMPVRGPCGAPGGCDGVDVCRVAHRSGGRR